MAHGHSACEWRTRAGSWVLAPLGEPEPLLLPAIFTLVLHCVLLTASSTSSGPSCLFVSILPSNWFHCRPSRFGQRCSFPPGASCSVSIFESLPLARPGLLAQPFALWCQCTHTFIYLFKAPGMGDSCCAKQLKSHLSTPVLGVCYQQWF